MPVTPAAATTTQSSAAAENNVVYLMTRRAVAVTSPPPPPGPTLTANPSSITAGQSSTLTLTTPTNNYHNIFINGVRPTCTYSSTSVVCTMTVTPASTTTYQSSATDANNVPYTMPSVTVTVTPPPPSPPPTPPPTPSPPTPAPHAPLTPPPPTTNYHT